MATTLLAAAPMSPLGPMGPISSEFSTPLDPLPEDPELTAWRTRESEKLDTIALDPTAFDGKDLSFSRDPEEGKRLAINDAFLQLHGDDDEIPTSGLSRDLLRVQLAERHFQGRGAESEDAFHGEIVKQAQGRKDGKELRDQLNVSAFDDAMLPSDEAGGFGKFRETLKSHPGYDPAHEADYFEAWHDTRRAAKEQVDAFREPLVQVWRAFKTDGNVTAAAFDAWQKLTPEQRPEFLDALAIRAKALPDEERATFWANLGKQTELAISDYGRTAAESATSLTLAEPTPMALGIADVFHGTENYPAAEADRQRAKDEFQHRRNFAADVRKIAREDYDPLKSADGSGNKPGFWEGVAYQVPGVTGISLTMAVPVAGMGTMAFAMEGQAYEDLRGRMLASGMDDAKATEYAEGLAPFVAMPQAALEKVGFGIWSRKLPGFSKVMDTLGDRITNRLLRGTVKAGVIATAETGIELLQDATTYAVQDIAAALAADVPDVNWEKELSGTWASAPEIFATMLPLAILGAAGGLSQESRAAAFKASSTWQKQARGWKAENIAELEAAQGPAAIAAAIDNGEANRDPDSPEAAAAVEVGKQQLATTQKAQADLEQLGYAAPSFVTSSLGVTVFDGDGSELGTAPDLSGAVRIARAHTVALDDMESDQVAALGSLMEAAKAAVELDPSSSVDVNLGEFDPAKASPEMAARFAAQVALKEQAEGGTGAIARSVLGYSVTEFAQGVRHTVNNLFRGAAVTDVFHETFHGLRRQAKAAGTLTRADEIGLLRALDTILGGKTTKAGVQLRFIPENLADEQISETLLDEAIAEIAEMEILRTRKGAGKGKLGVTRGVISRNLTALSKLMPGVAGKWQAFMQAVRARWGLSLSRAIAVKKAERDGKFDKEGYDAFLDKLLGLDAQVEHDAGVVSEFDRILALPEELADDDIPFSIGNAAASTTVFDEARKALRGTQPMIGAFSREMGIEGGQGWNRERGMSNNAANAIDEGKMPEPEFREWLADTLKIPTVSVAALSAGNAAAGNHYREYHHMGRNRATVDFYDPAEIELSPKFFLGMGKYFDTHKTGKKAAAEARGYALTAWKNLKKSLIEEGRMGDWKGSETKEVRNQSARMAALDAQGRDDVKNGKPLDQVEMESFKRQTAGLETEAAALRAQMDKRQAQIDKWTKKIEEGERPPYDGYLESQISGLAAQAEQMAGLVSKLEERTPTRAAEAAEMSGDRATVPGSESRQSEASAKGGNLADSQSGASSFSLGPAQVADIMAGNALARITDPRRRTQVMARIARDFNSMRLQIDRMASLSGVRRSKGDLRREAAAREDLRAEELIADVHRRFGEIMADEDLVKIKSQPVHAALADPTSPLRGRLKSKAAAIREHPDMFQLHRAGDYDGSDGVSRSVFGGQRMPDQAAQELYDAGLIPEPTADALWESLLSEQKTVKGMKELLQKATEQIREAKAQAKQEATEWLQTQGKDQEVNFSDKEEIRRSLRMLDAILLALPPEIRGKIGGYTQISMITTDEARLAYLKDKLAKADGELETYLRTEYAKEWEALLKKAAPAQNEPGQRPTGSIAADAYDIFRVAEAAMGMSFATGEAEADKWDAIADHPDTEPKDADLARVKAQMTRLTMNWTAADAARREQAVLEGEKIYYNGLLALRVEASRRRERLDSLRSSAITGTGKEGTRMQRKAAEVAAKSSKGREALQMAWEFLSFGQVVNVLFGENSAAAKWFNARELAASNAFEDAFQAKANAIEALFTTLSGNRFGGEALKHRMSTVETIIVTDALGVQQTFTDAQAITFLLMWRQEDGKRHMQGIIDEDGNVLSQWAWDDKSAAAIELQLSPQGHAVMAFLGQSYGEEYGRINAVFRRIWNVSMPRHKMYSPLSVAPVQGKGDTIMDPVSGDTMGAGMTPGSLKNRSFSAIAEPLFKDAFQVYVSHARQMEHFIAYGEFARDALGVVNRRETRNAIEAAGGPFAAGVLSKWLDFFAVGGVKDANMGGATSRTVGGLIGRLSQAALIGRVSVLAMQSLQLAAAAHQMPVGAYLTRLAKLSVGRLGWAAAVNSEYIQRRVAIMPPIVRDAVQGLAAGTPNRAKYFAAELGKTISGADALFTGGTYAIFYDYHLKLATQSGISNPEAHAHSEAARLTDTVAQPVRIGARSWLEVANQGNPAFRAMWNFSSDPRQKMALAVYAAMRKDKAGAEKAAAIGKALTLTWIGGGILAGVLRAAMRDLRDDDDEEWFDERHWNPKRLALMALNGPLGGIPYVGEVIENNTYKLTGEYMPAGGMLAGIGQSFSVVPKWFEGDFDLLKDAEKIFTDGAAVSGTSAAAASALHILRDAWGILENVEGPD